VAEVNPYHVSDDMRWMEERIGKERSRGAYAFRKLKDAGAVLVFGSDSPGTNAARYFLSPVYGLYAAVSRQTLTGEPKEGWFPDQRLTIEEAIDAPPGSATRTLIIMTRDRAPPGRRTALGRIITSSGSIPSHAGRSGYSRVAAGV
jgi:predicted amidohydrolase YtcJ